MNLQQFIDKYNGKYVEYHSYDPRAKNQCVDLANAYIVEVLGKPAIIGTNAMDFPKKKDPHFTFIENKLDIFPEPGDLMIFKSADGVGHISIFVAYIHQNLFTSFDQNYPTGSPCKLVNHTYANVLGWLRIKNNTGGVPSMPDQDLIDQLAWYQREYPLEQQRVQDARRERDEALRTIESQKADIQALKELHKIEIGQLQTEARIQKENFQDFKRRLAEELKSSQDEAVITGEVSNLVEVEELLRTERLKHEETKETLSERNDVVDALNRQIESLKEQLRVARGLGDATAIELISELLNRLLKIKKGE